MPRHRSTRSLVGGRRLNWPVLLEPLVNYTSTPISSSWATISFSAPSLECAAWPVSSSAISSLRPGALPRLSAGKSAEPITVGSNQKELFTTSPTANSTGPIPYGSHYPKILPMFDESSIGEFPVLFSGPEKLFPPKRVSSGSSLARGNAWQRKTLPQLTRCPFRYQSLLNPTPSNL